ncbi:MAG: D-alanyl-D-alanine carboxypeptidase/D-alanyl-D-alanine-endopeptidase [Bryobacteraceae bacterium]
MHRFLFLLCTFSASAAPLREQVEKIIAGSEAASRAFWGIQVTDPTNGRTVFESNSGHYFIPASNTKLFSTALALLRLGPGYRFTTTVTATAATDAQGRIRGDVSFVGAGDPNLSARELPYRKGPITGNALKAVDDLADQLVERGVRVIEGDVIGDDRLWPWDPYPEGWAIDDAVSEDGAPVSALTINDNRLKVQLRAGNPGDPVLVSFDPPLTYYFFHNGARTGPRGSAAHIEIDRAPGSREVVLRGTLPAGNGGISEYIAIDDPALFAANALRDALIGRGIVVRGQAVARHRGASAARGKAAAVLLASHQSLPLVESLRVIDKVSQNLHAEMVLRETARVLGGDGSRQLGLEALQSFLGEIGVPKEEYRFEDGSGLSRLNLVTPQTVATLLVSMYRSQYKADWMSFMPIGGEDGTLEKRFANLPGAARIHAKTGSLSHVAALSGYATTQSGTVLAFSVMANNFNGPASEIRAVIDKIAVAIANLE